MRIPLIALCCSLVAVQVSAQPPRVVNARLAARAIESDLSRTLASIAGQQVEPAWVGYGVPIFNWNKAGNGDGWSERCRLEQNGSSDSRDLGGAASGPIRLEASPTLMVLIRVENREVQRIRTLSSDCAIDAGGLPLYWFDNVNAAQSVVFLKGVAAGSTLRGQMEAAMTALSLHQEPSAAAALLDLAKSPPDSRVRQRAMFWVARRAEAQAVPALTEAIERDPDVEVKKQAVFGLSQLPGAEGVPLLIRLARTNTNPAVRKQAIFWLGQSKDPRAVAYFEEILR
jgi:hypothetical protein